jgi:hypothetical protein
MEQFLDRFVLFPSFAEPYIGCIVLVLVFVSALLGRLIRRKLPDSHLEAQTEAVVKMSMGVVGTLTALVLGLLVATANSSFTASSQEVTNIAANVIQLDHLLRRYGPEADGVRDLLRRYTAMKLQDLFPESNATKAILDNPQTVSLFEELQNRLSTLEAHSANQRWLQSEAQRLTTAVVGSRWLLVERVLFGIPIPLLMLVVFWLCLLFMSFGLFAPPNATVTVALFLCALAVAGAVQMVLDLNRPFVGSVRMSGEPMRYALEVVSRE